MSPSWPRIGTAFTGYLVQTNFDSQWISFEAKDGLNAVGIGAFFNVTNLGQTLLLHACLLPLGRRSRGGLARAPRTSSRRRATDRRCRQSTPYQDVAERTACHEQAESRSADIAAQEWKGPWRRYDIVKEGVVALVVVSVLTS